MKIAVLLLALLAVSECIGSRVEGRTGQNVTLPCKYDFSSHGALSVCWGRGQLPASHCNDQLVSTDGHKVEPGSRASSRYQLLGRLDAGDVSLTILNVSEGDAGRYGCKVEIPGWLNDEKHHIDLIIERAAQTTTSSTAARRETSAEPTAAGYTTGQMTSTEGLQTSSFNSTVAEQDNSSVTVVLVCVLLGLALVAAGGVLIIVRSWRRLIKTPQQQFNSSIQFSATSPTLQIHSPGSAVENIYQIDGGGDGGEYEYCP